MVLALVLALSAADLLSAQLVQADFRNSSFAGKWFDIYHTKDLPYTTQWSTDITYNFQPNLNGTMTATIQEWMSNVNRWRETSGILSQGEKIDLPAVMSLKLTGYVEPVDFRVLYSDYVNVAVIYNDKRNAWVLSRARTMDDNIATQLFALLRQRLDFRPYEFVKIVHGVGQSSFQTYQIVPNALKIVPNTNIQTYQTSNQIDEFWNPFSAVDTPTPPTVWGPYQPPQPVQSSNNFYPTSNNNNNFNNFMPAMSFNPFGSANNNNFNSLFPMNNNNNNNNNFWPTRMPSFGMPSMPNLFGNMGNMRFPSFGNWNNQLPFFG